MNSIKNILVDLCGTVFIGIAIWLHLYWMWWVVAIYTVLMLIIKGLTLYSDKMLRHSQKSKKTNELFLHTLCVLNIILLAYASWWYIAALWVLIWLFSYIARLKIDKTTVKK